MGTYRSISVAFWSDPKVEDNFTPEDKYFFLYLLTNRHSNLCGCYEISKRQMSKETGYNVEVIENLLYRFKSIHNVIDYDENTQEMLVINWHKYNWSMSDKLIKGVEKVSEYIKNSSFKAYVFDVLEAYKTGSKQYPNYAFGYPIHRVSYPMDTSVSVSVSNTVNDNTLKDNDDSILEDFEEWWKAYPRRRRKAKQECRKKYLNALKNNKGLTPDGLLSALEAQKKSQDWLKDNGEYVPAPLTWLNHGRWEDEIYDGSSGAKEELYSITEEDKEYGIVFTD